MLYDDRTATALAPYVRVSLMVKRIWLLSLSGHYTSMCVIPDKNRKTPKITDDTVEILTGIQIRRVIAELTCADKDR